MKRILLVIAFLLLLSCDKNYDAPLHNGEQPHYFVNVVNSYSYTIQEVLDKVIDYYELDASDYASLISIVAKFLGLDLNSQLHFVTLAYNTVDPYGKPVVATGTIVYPDDLSKARVVEILPTARLNWRSNSTDFIERNIIDELTFCLFGQISIFPDMIGAAPTPDYDVAKYIKPIINKENNGRVSYDMRRAVAEYLFLNENGYCLPRNTYIIGYSLGGHTAMEVAEYYTETTNIHIEEVFCGGGFYDANVAFEAYSKWTNMEYVAIPYVVLSTAKYFNIALDYSKIFTGTMANPNPVPSAAEGGDGYAYWFDNTHSASDIYYRFGSNIHNYMHPDFFTKELNGEFKKLQNVFSQNSVLENFYPNKDTHIHIFHATDDDYVPFECGQALYEALKQRTNNVFIHPISGGHASAEVAINIALKIIILLKTGEDSHSSETLQELLNQLNL